jgi:L-threonylcarbamoyladenylate synthase
LAIFDILQFEPEDMKFAENDKKNLEEAILIVKKGGIVIFPTDTAYGIGCRIDDVAAVGRLFHLRKRPENKAVPVLVSSIDMAREYWEELPDEVEEKLINKHWPGALTIVLPARIRKVSELARGGGKNLGLRMPDNDVLLDIIAEVGVPIIGTSANFAGEATPYRFEDLDSELVRLVDFVIKGKCSKKEASTVIDCTVNPWKVLRKGAVEFKLN